MGPGPHSGGGGIVLHSALSRGRDSFSTGGSGGGREAPCLRRPAEGWAPRVSWRAWGPHLVV